jgi:hypothetical protein
MGLAERRAAKEFETNVYPGLKQQIDAVAGFEVPLEVKWDTLMKQEKYIAKWNESWPQLYFLPIVEAFKAICIDQMGKDALKDGVKNIIVQDTQESYSSPWASFDKATGTLTLDHQYTNVDDVRARAQTLQMTLEKDL